MHASALLEVGYKNCFFIPEKAEGSPFWNVTINRDPTGGLQIGTKINCLLPQLIPARSGRWRAH
jgi:hypothetical protein